MDIKPSADVLQAIGSLHAERFAAKPRVAAPAVQAVRQTSAPNTPPQDINPARLYRPGSFLDIFV
jgi:hypothetical protein